MEDQVDGVVKFPCCPSSCVFDEDEAVPNSCTVTERVNVSDSEVFV